MDALGWDRCDVARQRRRLRRPSRLSALRRPGARAGGLARGHHRPAGLVSPRRSLPSAHRSVRGRHRRQRGFHDSPTCRPASSAAARTTSALAARPAAVPTAPPWSTPTARGAGSHRPRRPPEASLRRLAHYDYWDDKVRRSLVVDARADLLVYGMGESQILAIARRLADGEPVDSLDGIPGTVVVRAAGQAPDGAVVLPSYETVAGDRDAYNEAFRLAERELAPATARPVVQPHGDRIVVQFPPAPALTTAELDALYELPFQRRWHPDYDAAGGVPALETVRTSITAHRGCCGDCSFCAITSHQGRIVTSRSERSILAEARRMAADPDFKGTITDVGGPTANLYGARCKRWDQGRFCQNKHCLLPERCEHLQLGYDRAIPLYRKLAEVPGVKHVFLGSGLRFDLLVRDSDRRYLEQVAAHQVSGLLKVAPEHCDDHVLGLMAKPRFAVYEEFVKRFRAASLKAGKQQYIVNYFIASHPGSSLQQALKLALYLAKRRIKPEQIQDFIPTPMTRATAMYHTGSDPLTRKRVHVPRSLQERRMQRALLQYDRPANRKLLEAALLELGAMHVLPKFLGASEPAPAAERRARKLPARGSGKRIGKSKPRQPRRRS
ncbi:MAG: YgiQ family radical SAM protein [Candidatus Krumholzibacteriia bacterium]